MMKISRTCTETERERLEAILAGLVFELAKQNKIIITSEGLPQTNGENTDFLIETFESLENEEFDIVINSLTDSIIENIFGE